jgi:ribosome-associated translation inhibitor RaiA
MQVQVHTDNHVEGSEGLRKHVESVIEDSLSWIADRVTRADVYLRDENSGQKQGDNDKRCVIEVRLAGHGPVSVTADSATIDQALTTAIDKLERSLEHTLGKLERPKDRTSSSGDPA